jgi:peptidyl-tRNA hydrolase
MTLTLVARAGLGLVPGKIAAQAAHAAVAAPLANLVRRALTPGSAGGKP